jgi:energy-coupling factor transport system substrate-specific component
MATATGELAKKKWYQFDVRRVVFPQLKPMHLAAIIPMCVAMNFAGSVIVQSLKLPIFLDFGGTILATMIGGWWPGVIVGLITIILQGLLVNPTSFAFLPLPLVGVTVLWLCLRNGLGRTWLGFIVTLILFSFSLTLVTAPVVAFAFGGFTGAAWDVGTAVMVTAVHNILSAAIITQGVESLIDKGILFFVVIAILRALPPYWRVTSPVQAD